MRPYLAVFAARFRALLQYRAAAAAGIVTQVFWGLIRVMIFGAFYASTSAVQPMTYPEVVTYVWLGQAMLLLVMFGPDPDVRQMILTGTVAYELARPVDLYGLWYGRALAQRLAPLLLRIAPVLALAWVFFDCQAPASVACAGLWIVSTAAAAALAAAVSTLMTVSLLWTVSGEGVARLGPAVIWILSGIMIPLPLYPDWAQPLLAFLPFRGMADTPYRIYMGHIAPLDAGLAIGHQAVWTLGFVLLGRALLSRGSRRLVAQGG